MHWQELAFLSIVVTLVAGLHLYLGWRLFGAVSGLARWRRAGWGLMVLSAALVLLAFPGGSRLPRSGELLTLQYAGFFVMGLILVLFPLTLLRDVVLLVRRGAAAVRPPSAPDPARRDFLRAVSSLGVIGSSSALTATGTAQARQRAEVKRVRVPIEGLHPDLVGLRIAQISDLHLGPILRRAWLEEVVSAVNQLRPDLIAVTGDLVDGHVADLRDEVGALRRLRAPHGVYFVTGNHEYYWDALAWVEEVRRLGLDVLVNEHRVVARGAARLVVAGVTDFSARTSVRRHASDPGKALAGAPEADLRLLLAHQPKSVLAARKLGVDLQLSGHTHGGQFFPWNLVVGFFHPLAKGLGRFDRTWLYVSCGTGTWGPPLRTGVPAEITELELVDAAAH